MWVAIVIVCADLWEEYSIRKGRKTKVFGCEAWRRKPGRCLGRALV